MTVLKTKGLKLTYGDGSSETKYIYKGRTWTPWQFCVDHGDYYEIARYSNYLRVDKKTMQITIGSEDDWTPYNAITAEIVRIEPKPPGVLGGSRAETTIPA